MLVVLSWFVVPFSNAQTVLPVYPDSLFNTYYHQRRTLFEQLPQTKGDIIFIGNSITDGNEWGELFNDLRVKNRGISGDISAGVIRRIGEVVQRKPDKVFLMIGVNDLARGIVSDSVVNNILLLADYLYQQSPRTAVFVQSILPVNPAFGKFTGHTDKADLIRKVNTALLLESGNHHYRFIDLHTVFCDKEGRLDSRYTNDGLHLLGDGYLLWKHLVFPYVYGLQEKPSLLPLPAKLEWKDGRFALYRCHTIVSASRYLSNETAELQTMLRGFGYAAIQVNEPKGAESYIELQLVPGGNEEEYKLEVSEKKILLQAASPHGIFNGLQTLRQLLRDGCMADACSITDRPAYAWRGYMIDVGRNYMSLPLLKQQIEVMGRYKFNVFHFHATEDIAWRFASRQFPQLNAPQNMLRDKGLYYTEQDLKELIAYCRARHIQFVPEIDMPGHSGAFRRALNTDMQSDSGMRYMKAILKEFCETYDVPLLHIGGDEVKISNKNFMPEMTAWLQGLGKSLIGWQPGGNLSNNTIRQLWMDDGATRSDPGQLRYVDSRHLYLNHMDPLEAVVTLFNRRIGDRDKGDPSMLGGTICLWHDRAIATEEDLLKMNPVYPAMLAFAERSWRGGGKAGWISNISDGDEAGFSEFEKRLLDQRELYFRELSFPYAPQSGMSWKLYGPFYHEGNVARKFAPEEGSWFAKDLKENARATGGTIVLRHWWAPLIKGAVDSPEENTTWYATTRIWSEEEAVKKYWIGFNNLSRSPASDSPPEGAWDKKGSEVWVNGQRVAPPRWRRAGQQGNAEIPLTDEGYEYREPAMISLHKGWNTVLIKAPVGSFRGKDWQNPVKWMFTFVECPELYGKLGDYSEEDLQKF